MIKNSKGFAHWFILALFVVVIIGGIGSYLLTRSDAATVSNPFNSRAICTGSYYHRVWSNGTCLRKCQTGYKLVVVAGNGYDYCVKIRTTARCILSAPKSVREGQKYVMSLTINNTGNVAYKTKFKVAERGTLRSDGQHDYAYYNSTKTYTTGLIQPKKAAIFQLAKVGSNQLNSITYNVSSLDTHKYACSATVTIYHY